MTTIDQDEPIIDANGLEILAREESMLLLGGETVGRVGLTMAAMPVVLPVNYRLLGDEIVFRTSPGSKFDAAVENAVVAFEVDRIEPFTHAGWSILVTGIARVVADPAEQDRYAAAHVPRWATNPDEHFITISTAMISGRRLHPGAHAPTTD